MKFKLFVVGLGFSTASLILLRQAAVGSVPAGPLAATFLLALALAVRYVWVIFLLKWPLRVIRVALLLVVWCAVPWAAWVVWDEQSWLFTLALLCGAGAATEFYNFFTRQWKTNSAELTRVLKQDHIAGGITAVAAAGVFAALALRPPGAVTVVVVMVLVLGDWARLIWMVSRHRRVLYGA